jgi:methyl-accepting chemotaxis protein
MYANLASRLTVSSATDEQIEVDAGEAPPPAAETEEAVEIPGPEPELDLLEEAPAPEPELERFDESPEPEPIEFERDHSARMAAAPVLQPAPKLGWGRFLLVGLVSAVAGALLALLLLFGINNRLDYLAGDALRPVWTQAGELEGRLITVDTELAQMREQLATMQDLGFRLDDTQADMRQLSRTLSAMESELEVIHQDLNDLAGNIDAYDQRADALAEQLDVLAGTIDAYDQRADALAEQLDVLAENLSSIRDAVQRFDSFLDTLRHFLNESMGSPTPTPWATDTP